VKSRLRTPKKPHFTEFQRDCLVKNGKYQRPTHPGFWGGVGFRNSETKIRQTSETGESRIDFFRKPDRTDPKKIFFDKNEAAAVYFLCSTEKNFPVFVSKNKQ
jgi:hypothetical protein